jgi:hypothetical protein
MLCEHNKHTMLKWRVPMLYEHNKRTMLRQHVPPPNILPQHRSSFRRKGRDSTRHGLTQACATPILNFRVQAE